MRLKKAVKAKESKNLFMLYNGECTSSNNGTCNTSNTAVACSNNTGGGSVGGLILKLFCKK